MSVKDIRKVMDGLWENVEGGVASEDEDGDEDEGMDETTEDDAKGKMPKSVAREQAQRNKSKRKRTMIHRRRMSTRPSPNSVSGNENRWDAR
jgi:hypothetical protein